MLLKYSSVPVYAPGTVGRRLCGMLPELEDRVVLTKPGVPVHLGSMTITAFRTSHDADGSVGYRLDDGEVSFGLCTDTGVVTDEILAALQGCSAALIEANHDLDMLYGGPYPLPLKRRILSQRGHLSNAAAAELACALAGSGTGSIVLGHLSRENNTPRKAYTAVREALDSRGFGRVELLTAAQDEAVSLEVPLCCASR
jgi:phosphoribosyl 1,2-cyclic phosphodiesterase